MGGTLVPTAEWRSRTYSRDNLPSSPRCAHKTAALSYHSTVALSTPSCCRAVSGCSAQPSSLSYWSCQSPSV